MKTRTLLWLAALQLGLIAWVHNPLALEDRREAPWLADFSVEAITVADREGTARRLERRDSAWWVLPEGLPADEAKLEGLLNRLNALAPNPPLATSTAAAKRFAVEAEGTFERRITLTAGTAQHTFFLGQSQGPRHSALRWAESAEIYRVPLTPADWPLALEDWLDRSLLAVPEAEQGTLTLGARMLSDADDAGAVATLRQRLAALRVSRLATEDEDAEAEALAPLTVDTPAGETLTLRLARLGAEESPTGYVLTSSARPESFYLAPYQGRPLRDALAALESTPSP